MHFRLRCLYGEPTVSRLRKMSPGKQHKRVVWDIVGSSHLLHRNSGLSNLPGSLGIVVALQCLAFFSGGHSRCSCKLPWFMSQTMR